MTRNHVVCPRCSAPLVVRAPEVPWCSACEWNLAAFDRLTVPTAWGNRLLDRAAHRVAFWLDDYGFRRLAGKPVRRRGGRFGRALLLGFSALVVALGPASLIGGVYLMLKGPGATPILGLVLTLLAVAVRPRLTRGLPDDMWVVTRESAPTLYAVLDRTAAAARAPMPDVVGFAADVNASASRRGRRRVLCVGLPLWAALPPQQRIALLGHELGHFVNGDVRSIGLVASARHTLSTLIDALGIALFRVLGPLAIPLMLPLDLMLTLLLVLGQRDGQRAEYLADQIGSEVAGAKATADLLDFALIAADLVPTLMALHGRAARPDDWRTAGEQALRNTPDLEQLRQRSLRTQASLLATHPPAGRRARMAHAHPDQPPAVTMSEPEAQRIDTELSSCYDRLRARAAEAAYT
ncbi:M48 family metalloprotease [Dactylosporangium sp. NPDC051484]|uniref:M48 family metalloprotease n=1 Tax=Dactylosporangium sp. NPDC051484 TaxID=3154942 RepID=UPI00344DADFF